MGYISQLYTQSTTNVNIFTNKGIKISNKNKKIKNKYILMFTTLYMYITIYIKQERNQQK